MKENFLELRKKFTEIRNLGYIKPLRTGSTGIGYTFETLLNKEEDTSCIPDYKGIEIKTKLGYSKYPLKLFTCIPNPKGEISAARYILEKYGYIKFDDKQTLIFSRTVYCNKVIERYGYSFKLRVDYLYKELVMEAYYQGIFVENVCTWDFKNLERKLKTKLKYLAVVKAYPYYIDKKEYIKYLKMDTYALYGFFEFLKLIENDCVQVEFYIKKKNYLYEDFTFENHGVAFKLEIEYLEQLFRKLPY